MGVCQRDARRIDDLDLGFSCDECRDTNIIERGFQRYVVRTKLPQSHHGIQGISLLRGMPKVLGETRRMDVKAGRCCNLCVENPWHDPAVLEKVVFHRWLGWAVGEGPLRG